MTNVPMKDFLRQYFRQAVFNNMPKEQFDRYQDYLNSGDLTGHMKDWKKWKLVVQDGGIWQKNTIMPGQEEIPANPTATPPIPHTNASDTQMTDADWEKLYRKFRDAFFSMNAKRKDFADNDKATKYLTKYFGSAGSNALFETPNPTPEQEGDITDLKGLLGIPAANWPIILKQWGLFETREKAKDFIDDLNNGKYKTDSEHQQKLLEVVEYIQYYSRTPDFMAQMTQAGITNIPDMPHLEGIKVLGNDSVDRAKLARFRVEYRNLLNPLVNQSKVYDVFKNHGSDITNHLDKAREDVDYNNKESKSYIEPKREDKNTNWGRFTKKIKDAITPFTDKWTKIRGGHVYHMPQAKHIVDATAKVNFHPTNGLNNLIENADKIKKAAGAEHPNTRGHVDWTFKTLQELQSSMPNAVKGALKSGHLMKHVANAIMLKAAQEDKVEEAKTALEVLSVCRYGYLSSNTIDALKKEEFSIFSDSSLSWNKNQGIAVVTKALDKTLKASLVITGYTIAGARHAFSNLRVKNFKYQHKKELKKLNGKDNTQRQEMQADITEYQTLKSTLENNLHAEWRNAGYGNETDYTNDLNDAVEHAQTNVNTTTANFDSLKNDLQTWITTATAPGATVSPDDLRAAQTYMSLLQSGMKVENPTSLSISRSLKSLLYRIYNKQTILDSDTAALNNATDKRNKFKDGQDKVRTYEQMISNLNDNINNMDTDQTKRLTELHNFWNMMQSNSKKRTGHLLYEHLGSTKKQNAKFQQLSSTDPSLTNAQLAFKKYVDRHNIAA